MSQEIEIGEALGALCYPGQVVEIRTIGRDGTILSGYFDHPDKIIEKLSPLLDLEEIQGIYFTLNPVIPALAARRKDTIARPGKIGSTSDRDIECIRWLPVDLDPVRPSGISSSESEHAAALDRANTIASHLSSLKWADPIIADSGNGAHLLYRVNLPNTVESVGLVRDVLVTLSGRFTDDIVAVDTTVHNPARIWKLYGTTVRKGSNLPDRPWRTARFLSRPVSHNEVTESLLRDFIPRVDHPHTSTTEIPLTSRRLDLVEWLKERREVLPFSTRKIDKAGYLAFYELSPCPWGSHQDGAYCGQLENGAIIARCHHASCGGSGGPNRWPEIRALVDPKNPKTKKADDGEAPRRILPHFEKDGRQYLDVRDEQGRHWFAHLDDVGKLTFSREAIGSDGIVIIPRELPIHQDTGIAAPIVGLPSKEAMEVATVFGTEVLFKAIDKHLQHYIDMPDDDRTLFIYYLFYTWFYRKVRTAPYLRFLADTGKGKSRIIRAVSDLCFYPIRAAGASSFSGIFRTKEKWHGTLVVDESDFQAGADNPVVKYLNLGFESDQPFILSDKNDPTTAHIFDPFGPKVLGMRQPFGDNATEGRVLSFTPHETRRRDIPVELDDEYYEAVTILRAHLALFTLVHWSDVTTDVLMDVSSLDVEPRLKQMLRPISLVLSVFPDGEMRLINYVRTRQIEIRRERAASFDGLCFNLAVKLANGHEDLRDDPKFAKYYRRDGTLQAVEARMIATLVGVKTAGASKALRGMGFATKETSIKHETVAPAKEGEQGKIRERKLTVSKVIVPDAQAWGEMVSRYFFPERDEASDGGQTELDSIESADLECPGVLRGPRFIDAPCGCDSGTSGTPGTDWQEGWLSTDSTGSTGVADTAPALTADHAGPM